jgi:hypothetical protein
MKARALMWFALSAQIVFLVYWLFISPEVHGALRVARDELQKGDANLPALTVRDSDSTETTVSYDASKSASENLVARAILRLSIADGGYQSLVTVALLATLLNVVLLIALLFLNRQRSNQTVQATAAAPGG